MENSFILENLARIIFPFAVILRLLFCKLPFSISHLYALQWNQPDDKMKKEMIFLSIYIYIYMFLHSFFLKLDKTEDEEPPTTSANPVLELELTEEKLPMTLSRQEVGQPISSLYVTCMLCLLSWMNNQSLGCV